MVANLQGLEITDKDNVLYSFEPFKEDNTSRGIQIETRDWEIGDPLSYWKVPLFPFDAGLHQDRLPSSVNITNEFNKARSYSKANMDASNQGVLVPPPAVTSTELTNSVEAEKQKPFAGKQFFLCGRYIYTISRDGALDLDKDFGSGKAAVDFEVFNNELIVAMGESEKIWKRATDGTWTQASDNTFAIALGKVGNKLWRAESTNKLSSCTTTPLTLSSWTPTSPNQYTAGDTSYAISGIIEYAGVPVVLRPDGVFMPDTLSEFHNQAPQIEKWPHDDNGKGAFTAQGFLWVPTVVGLLRITYGESLVYGPEKSNRPDFRFWVRAGIEWGEAIYLLVTDEIQGEETFICKMTRDFRAITDNHAYIYHEWCRLGSIDKGYTIGVNTWPSGGIITSTRDAGTIANVAGAGVDWSNATNAASNDSSYATAGQGTTDALRFSNFGFSIPSDAALLGFIAYVVRKTSVDTAEEDSTDYDIDNVAGIGSLAWNAGSSTATATNNVSGLRTTNYARFDEWGFNLPDDASIIGIEISFTRLVSNTNPVAYSATDNIISLCTASGVVGSNKARDTWSNGIIQTVQYGDDADNWGLNLTGADVNSPGFGFVVSVNVVGNGTQLGIGSSNTRITLTYSTDGTVDSAVRLINGAGSAEGDNKAKDTSWPTADALVQYGGLGDLWGADISVSEVNDSDFGFSISVTNTTGTTASINYGYMAVIYRVETASASPKMFIGHGFNIKSIQMGFGSGRDIDDPNYPFALSGEIETGLIQPTQDVTLVSGLIGVSMVAKVRANDSVTLQYALGEDSSYTDLLNTQEGSGTAAITGTGKYEQVTRYAPPNTTSTYFKFKLKGTFDVGSGQDRFEVRNLWAYGYSRPKVTDFITVPIYADRMAFNANGIPTGKTGGDFSRLFREWKRDQEVLVFRFPEYELGRTIRVRVVNVSAVEIITEKKNDGHSRETFIVNVTFMRDDFANAYANEVT